MVKCKVNAESNAGPNGYNGNADRYSVAPGNSPDGTDCMSSPLCSRGSGLGALWRGCGDSQGANHRNGKSFTSYCVHLTPHVIFKDSA
jgi:hypothetical protein